MSCGGECVELTKHHVVPGGGKVACVEVDLDDQEHARCRRHEHHWPRRPHLYQRVDNRQDYKPHDARRLRKPTIGVGDARQRDMAKVSDATRLHSIERADDSATYRNIQKRGGEGVVLGVVQHGCMLVRQRLHEAVLAVGRARESVRE